MTGISEPIRDSLGHVHDKAGARPAIASLAPPISATLLALGLGERIIARTEACRDIDDDLAGAVSLGPVGQPDFDCLLASKASHVIMPAALRDKSLEEKLREAGIVPVYTAVTTIADNFAFVRLLGELFDRSPDADGLARRIESAVARARMAVRKARELRVVYINRLAPAMSVDPDSYTTDLLRLVRLKTIGNETGIELNFEGALLLGADGVLFNGAKGLFRRADIKAFAASHDIDPAQCLPLFADLEDLYGVALIDAIDELLLLRDKIRPAV